MTTNTPVYDVLAVGIAAVDDTLTLETFPSSGAKVPVLASARSGGGLACTAIAAAAVLGGRTAYIARFGQDDLSHYIRSILVQRRVDVSHIIPDVDGQPYHSHIVIDRASGERTIFYNMSRFKPVLAEDVPERLLASAGVLLVDFLAAPGPLELVLKARRAKVPVVADIEGQAPDVALLVEQVDHLVVPEEFARWFSGQQDLKSACAVLARTPRTATVVTAGAAGCWWTDSPERPPVHRPAFAVQAVNTNGCGDTYHGAYALAIARQFSVLEAVTFASASAAIKAAEPGGGWEALPTSTQVAELLRQRLAADDPIRSLITRLNNMS